MLREVGEKRWWAHLRRARVGSAAAAVNAVDAKIVGFASDPSRIGRVIGGVIPAWELAYATDRIPIGFRR